MASVKTIRNLLERLEAEGLQPSYAPLPCGELPDWETAPSGVDPGDGKLPDDRLGRKRWQIESLIRAVSSFICDSSRIVDFGSSSGHAGIPLAHLFPQSQVTLVEKKAVPVDIAQERCRKSKLSNVEIIQSDVRNYQAHFDVGVGIHLCGEVTDFALNKCIENDAAYVLCPCDLGDIKNSTLDYPRSAVMREHLTRHEYDVIARAADRTGWEFDDELSQLGKMCMGFISLDRNLSAQEHGYETMLHTMEPREASPKNDVIRGCKEKK